MGIPRVSDLYGKKVISLDGKVLGEVKALIIDFEGKRISHLLLCSYDELKRSKNPREALAKNGILFSRVKKIGKDTIIVGSEKVSR
ncbi:MAG: PRC-barrel domain-containing protein [Candidatus Micrarchaeaceae archaeon]